MIQRFAKVVNGVYRGGKPSPRDVVALKTNYNIKKIISLDQLCGDNIKEICNELGIEHYIIHLDSSRKSLLNLFRHNIKELLLDDGPVFFHCYHGKDRTGLLAAVFKCKHLGMSVEDAIAEAKSFDFGVGIDKHFADLYESIINSCEPTTSSDVNDATIVDNEREFNVGEGSYLDEANRSSFAPIFPSPKSFPFQPVYNEYLDQDDTRENHNDSIKPHTMNKGLPMSGYKELEQEIGGAGFVLNAQTDMIKQAYILNMSYDVSDLEKQKADKAVLHFDQSMRELFKASSYLNLILEPFEQNPEITVEDLNSIRAQLREYRDNSIDKFNNFKLSAVICLELMETFSSDTQLVKLIKVFVSSIENIEEQVNSFSKLFSNFEDSEFSKNIITEVTAIQKSSEALDDLVYDRVIKYIKSNILASNWVDSVNPGNGFRNKKKEPLMLDLYNNKSNSKKK